MPRPPTATVIYILCARIDRDEGKSVVHSTAMFERTAKVPPAKSLRNMRSSRVWPARPCTGNDGATSSRAGDVDPRERLCMVVILPRELKMRWSLTPRAFHGASAHVK